MRKYDKEIIQKKIDKAEIVSFDIFDTLVFRLVNKPSDVFEFVNLLHNSKSERDDNVYNFKSERIKAEEKARLKSGRQEVTLLGIYQNVGNYNNEIKRKLIEEELFCEKAFILPNIETIGLYRYALKNNKKVIIISDTYLSETFIAEVLKKCGITGYHRLYVSSEHKFTKSSGELFRHILKSECISAGKWLHIGDDLRSDIINPGKFGIKTYHYKRRINSPKELRIEDYVFLNLAQEYRQKEKYRKLKGEPANKNKHDSDAYKFGYHIFGILILGYINWLHNKFLQNKISSVFFFSREGYFIKKAYDFYFSSGKWGNLKTNYLYVSRKSLYLPALTKEILLDDFSLFYPMKGKKVFENLCSLGICKEEALQFMKAHKLDVNEPADELNRYLDELKELIDESNKYRLQNTESYLSQFDFSGDFAIVDVGWSGGMQIAFEKILADMRYKNIGLQQKPCNESLGAKKKKQGNCYGYFLGQEYSMQKFMRKNGENNPYQLHNEGWLFNYDDLTNRQKILFSGNEIFELIFDPNEGTVIGYKKMEGKQYEPVLEKVEFSESYKIIELIQQGALDYIADVKALGLSYASPSADASFYNFGFFLQNPKKQYVEIFGDMVAYDSETRGKVKLAEKINSKNPNILFREFQKSYWKVGFLRRNFPHIHIKYAKLYYYVKKLHSR